MGCSLCFIAPSAQISLMETDEFESPHPDAEDEPEDDEDDSGDSNDIADGDEDDADPAAGPSSSVRTNRCGIGNPRVSS